MEFSASHQFSLDPITGGLKISDGLDAETTTSYDLSITVADGGGLSNTGLLTINVGDVNDNEHRFILPHTSFTMSESSNVGDVVATLSPLLEVDVTDTPMLYTYNAVSGNNNDRFTVC